MYFENTPFIFKTAYSIIRNFIHKETRRKIIFVKKSKNSDVNKDIDTENCKCNDKENVEYSEDKMDELF